MALDNLIHFSETFFPYCQDCMSPTLGIQKWSLFPLRFSYTFGKEMRIFLFINWESQNQKFSSLSTSEKELWINLSQCQTWKSMTRKMLKSPIPWPKERKTELSGFDFPLHRQPIWGWSHYNVLRLGSVIHKGTEGREPDLVLMFQRFLVQDHWQYSPIP